MFDCDLLSYFFIEAIHEKHKLVGGVSGHNHPTIKNGLKYGNFFYYTR